MPTVSDLTAKTAEMLGCHARAAATITDAVGLVLDAIVGSDASPSHADFVGVRFDADPEMLRVEIAAAAPSGQRAGWSIEVAVKERRQLDALRAMIPDVEFASHGHRHICRLVCALTPRP